METQPRSIRTFIYFFGGAALALIICLGLVLSNQPAWLPPDTLTIDTLVPDSADSVKRHFTPATLALRPITDVVPAQLPPPYTLRWRTGVGIPDQDPLYLDWPGDRPGWYLNWSSNLYEESWLFGLWRLLSMSLPDPRLGMEFVPMVHMRNGRLFPEPATLRSLAAQQRGLTWLIGNEPDVAWQDNTSPELYAIAYHHAYTAIKAGDPTAQVAIGGVSQVTPLRLAYLDRVWEFYQTLYGTEMPVDVWNMHAFVLREERKSWGVNIPPGFTIEQRGKLWDVADHDDLALVEEQVRAMRQWMVAHGQQEKPLWVTEYGILMPADYGFPPDRVIRFLEGTFDLFTTLRDPALGFSADDHRLVQRWNWFSARDSRYPTGNLFTDWGNLTAVGQALSRYLREHADY